MRRLFAAITIICLLLAIAPVSFAQKAKRQAKQKEQESQKVRLPDTIDINEEVVNRGEIIILAVKSTTTFHCPERPKQIIFGTGEKTPIIINYPTPDLPEIYLIPIVPDIYTDMTIIMPSGSFHLYVRTVVIKEGAKPGDYHSLVLIKNDLYKDELSRARKSLKTNEDDINKLNGKIAEMVKDVSELKVANEKSQAELLKVLATTTAIPSKAPTRQPIRQLSKATRTTNGWLAIFSIENRSKQSTSLDAVNCASNRILLPFEGTQSLAQNSETKIPILIKDQEDEKAAKADAPITNVKPEIPITITFIVNGSATTLKIEI